MECICTNHLVSLAEAHPWMTAFIMFCFGLGILCYLANLRRGPIFFIIGDKLRKKRR